MTLEGFAGFEVAGAGYINARLDRACRTRDRQPRRSRRNLGDDCQSGLHSLVEHTSINPNKAAHVGHLRNAILGDTFVRLLRAAGQKVDVQNYIDNTGVQVADVVVGFLHLEGKSVADVNSLVEASERASGERIDYYCWDLYAKTSHGTNRERTRRTPRARACATRRCTRSNAAAMKRPTWPN